MTESPETSQGTSVRWTLIRDIAVFQGKLLVDGLRDLILVPASLIAGIMSLASGSHDQPGTQFYRLLGVGKNSERWINLFGALRNAPPDLEQFEPFPETDIDDIVGRIETFVVDEQKRGGMTAQARERLEKALDALQKRHRRKRDA
ncbi:MAG: hypothetical protein OER91_00585 [Gammaproteobacteria bacterium]|nr:hypothetical protein [Gammaproteobacteria bacterium]